MVALEDGSEIERGGDLLYAALDLRPSVRRLPLRAARGQRRLLRSFGQEPAQVPDAHADRWRPPVIAVWMRGAASDPAIIACTRGSTSPRRPARQLRAAGDGKVEIAKRNGGYGKYIRVRHTGEYSTAYGHPSRFAKGMGPGRRVRQGEVIGYVGTTGRSTGPHLHYEVLRHGAQINPLQIKQPANQQPRE